MSTQQDYSAVYRNMKIGRQFDTRIAVNDARWASTTNRIDTWLCGAGLALIVFLLALDVLEFGWLG